jgi:hypothetical protein
MSAPARIIGADRVPTGQGWSYEACLWFRLFFCGKFQWKGVR